MKLADLARQALGIDAPLPDRLVTGISQDHRKVRPGHIFVARVGAKFDGHRFARLAVERGAVAVVGVHDPGPVLPWEAVPYLHVADDRLALAKLAAAFHGHPSRSLVTVGVTGTDGKTTVSFLLRHLLAGEYRCGLVSTAVVQSWNRRLDLEGHFTTPEASEVQSYLAAFRDDGCTHAVLESSSHALSLQRLALVEYTGAVWTNLSPEHIDFHGSLESYRDAKLELVRRAGWSVLNADDGEYESFSSAAGGETVSYGVAATANWRAESVRETPQGLEFDVLHEGSRLPARLAMLGSFNVHNALAALAGAQRCGVDPEAAVESLASFAGVPGRMQVVHSAEFTVVVDFAHTGPALEKALAALRPVTRGRIVLVVGAAGERDPGKRRPIAAAAAAGADLLIFTEEDHRSEPLEQILTELHDRALEAGAEAGRVRLVPDRREAIAMAVGEAREGDLVLLAGKGHESTLERGDETIPWDEVAEARRLLPPD